MVRVAVVALLILRGVAKLVLDDQPRIDEQDDGVIEGGPADAEIFLVGHERIERVDVKMPVDGVDSVEYGVAFGRLTMSVALRYSVNICLTVSFTFLSSMLQAFYSEQS